MLSTDDVLTFVVAGAANAVFELREPKSRFTPRDCKSKSERLLNCIDELSLAGFAGLKNEPWPLKYGGWLATAGAPPYMFITMDGDGCEKSNCGTRVAALRGGTDMENNDC